MIRLWAARRLLGTTAPADRASLAASLARDRFMPVRREALSALAAHDAPNARDALMRALLDRHAAMRDLARYHLRQIGDCDPAAFYRAAMSTQMEATLAIAIRGVGETGAASDASLLLPHLASQSVAVRRAAVAALARLGSRDFSGALLKALTDPSPSVSAEACRGLRAAGLARDADPLVALLSGHPVAFVRKNALRLVLQLGKWDRLAPILAACRDPEECVSAPAQAAVRTWLARYNRAFTKPAPLQMAAAERELRQSQEFLGSGTVRELSAIFSEFNR
jgi:HEAT repeat protein